MGRKREQGGTTTGWSFVDEATVTHSGQDWVVCVLEFSKNGTEMFQHEFAVNSGLHV